MRIFGLLLLGAMVFVSCRITDRSDRDEVDMSMLNNPSSEHATSPEMMPKIVFEQDVHNFGVISQGEEFDHSFKFKNEGKSPLVLSFVEGSCGCTVMKDWPKEPIPPGESGEINIEFNSKGKSGTQNIAVRVVSNTTPATTVLVMEGEIVSPE